MALCSWFDFDLIFNYISVYVFFPSLLQIFLLSNSSFLFFSTDERTSYLLTGWAGDVVVSACLCTKSTKAPTGTHIKQRGSTLFTPYLKVILKIWSTHLSWKGGRTTAFRKSCEGSYGEKKLLSTDRWRYR